MKLGPRPLNEILTHKKNFFLNPMENSESELGDPFTTPAP